MNIVKTNLKVRELAELKAKVKKEKEQEEPDEKEAEEIIARNTKK